MTKLTALIFASALALAPIASFAADTAYTGTPAAGFVGATPGAAPTVGQIPRGRANPPVLSQQDACIKTICALRRQLIGAAGPWPLELRAPAAAP